MVSRGFTGSVVAAELAALLESTYSVEDLLRGVAGFAARAVQGAATASVTLAAAGRIVRGVAVDDRAARLDAHQRRHEVGPGPDALRQSHVVESVDLRNDGRWPAFARLATGDGTLSVRSVPMRVRSGAPAGVLTLYGDNPAAFGDPDRRLADLIAAHATPAVVGALRNFDDSELSAKLRQALMSRSAVDQAIGILMAEHACSAERALGFLGELAQGREMTVREAATVLVARTGGGRQRTSERERSA
jgi:hypothetical protein